MTEVLNLKIVIILTIGFTFATIFGYLCYKLKLSPILGYLIAGYIIGPYSPGYVADMHLAEQLAEVGVILMLFGVGLHFKWKDLLQVRKIAIPGAFIQTLVATILGATLIYYIGWSIEAGIIFGLSIGVASTVVLVRMLNDYNLLDKPEGHVAVGWLIVEDIITVVALLLIPMFESSFKGDGFSANSVASLFFMIVVKFSLLAIIVVKWGKKIVSFILSKTLLTHSNELFTLAILSVIFVIASASTLIFGTSIALGAFIAGMVIGQTAQSQQAAINAMPLKDTFTVIFFLSIGMLFDPLSILQHFPFFITVLGIILIAKPLTAFFITLLFHYPFKTALTVAVGLAQIGEFSFILSEGAMRIGILPDEGYDIIVACSLVSIAVNPLLFKIIQKNDAHSTKNSL